MKNQKIFPADTQIIKALTSHLFYESNKASVLAEQKICEFVVKKWEWILLAMSVLFGEKTLWFYVRWKNYLWEK